MPTAASAAMAMLQAVTESWSEPIEDDGTVVVLRDAPSKTGSVSSSDLQSAECVIQTPQGRIYAEVEGDLRQGAVLLATGGPGTSHDHYHPWFSRLAAYRAVVYIDYIGCGHSDRSPDGIYSIELFAENIESIRLELGLNQLALVGLSFGSYPALEYTLRHPDRVDRLVISSGHASAQTWQQTNIDGVNNELARLFPGEWSELLALRDAGVPSTDPNYQRLLALVLPDLEWVDPWGHPPLHDSGTFALDVYTSIIGTDPEWKVNGTLAGFDATPHLASVDAPTLVISGRYDRLTPPLVAHAIHAALPPDRRALHIFERSAHRPWAEEPHHYFQLLGNHLSGP